MGFGNDVGLAVLEGLPLTVAGGGVAFMVGAPSHWSEPTGSVGLNTRGGWRVSLAARGPGCRAWERWTLSGGVSGGSGRHSARLPWSWCVPETETGARGGPSGWPRLLSAKKLVLIPACLSQVVWESCEPVFWSVNGRGRSRAHMPSQLICPLPCPRSSSPNCRPSTTTLKLSCGSTLCLCSHAVSLWGKVCG